MIDIAQLRALNKPEQIAITEHARLRLVERGISVSDIIQCIDTGEIIRQYEDDQPFPSCLILGAAVDGFISLQPIVRTAPYGNRISKPERSVEL